MELFKIKLRKDSRGKSGVYLFTCNDYIYVGSTVNMHGRFYHHRNMLKKNKHGNKILQRLFLKYGEESINVKFIECNIDHVRDLEQKYIDLYKDTGRLMNHSLNAYCPVSGGFNQPHAEATKEKISKANKGKIPWNKGLLGKENPCFGRIKTPEEIENIRKSATGRLLSEETKRKISQSLLAKNNKKLNN